MCFFITVGVSERGVSALEALGRERYGFGVERCANPSVLALFPPGDALFFLTHGQCSCDLVGQVPDDDAHDEVRHRLKYRQKGWSEAKIDRALAASRSAKITARSGVREPVVKLMAALEQQVDLCGRVRIFAHQYRDDIRQEGVSSASKGRMSMEALRAAHGVFPTDTVVDLERDAG